MERDLLKKSDKTAGAACRLARSGWLIAPIVVAVIFILGVIYNDLVFITPIYVNIAAVVLFVLGTVAQYCFSLGKRAQIAVFIARYLPITVVTAVHGVMFVAAVVLWAIYGRLPDIFGFLGPSFIVGILTLLVLALLIVAAIAEARSIKKQHAE